MTTGFPVSFTKMDDPFRDFLVVIARRSPDSRARGRLGLGVNGDAGFHRARSEDTTAVIDLYSLEPPSGDRHARVLSGYVFDRRGLLGLDRRDADLLALPSYSEVRGNFACVELRRSRPGHQTEVDVVTDAFGLQPIFILETNRVDLISNRYHLLAIAASELGVARGADSSLLATAMFADSVVAAQIGATEMPIRGIRMLPPGVRVAVRDGHTRVVPPDSNGSSMTYGDLLERGAEELLANAHAILNEERLDARILNLTGGYDSRMILAAFRHLGAVDHLSAMTMRLDDEEDFAVAVRLAAQAGLPYRSTTEHQEPLAPTEHIGLWRTLHLGLYHDLGVTRTRADAAGPRMLRLIGGCGEVYRGYYQKIFPREALDLSGDEAGEAIYHYVLSFGVWDLLDSLDREAVAAIVRSSIMGMEGNLLREKLDRWYFAFRNRTHFGAQSAMSRYVSTPAVSPLISPSLRQAALRLDPPARESGQVVIDVLHRLDPELARLPFAGTGRDERLTRDSGSREFASGYSDAKARWDQGQRDSPRLELPTEAEWYQSAGSILHSACDVLSQAGAEYAFASSPAFQQRITWVSENRPHLFRWWTSRLAGAADSVALVGTTNP